MEQKNHNHNGFGNGFLLGLLVGIIVTLIFTTKKGRELFKEFTEKSLDRFSDLEKKLQETASNAQEFDEFDGEDDYVEPPSVGPERQEVRQITKSPQQNNGDGQHKSNRPHRFFRSKKS